MLVSITRLRVRSWRYMPVFVAIALRTAWQAKAAPGNAAVVLLGEAQRTYWTQTIWTDESAMRAFMRASVHRRAMGELATWCDEAAVAHWMQPTPQAATWDEAWRRMQREGRPSMVDGPSPAHQSLQIPAPQIGWFGEIRLK